MLGVRCWSGAYYLAGYAVERGLKACIIKYLMTTDQFPERRFSEQCWTHDLERLVILTGLKAIGPSEPVGRAILDAQRHGGRLWAGYGGTSLGGMSVDGAYVYPPLVTAGS